MKIVLNGTPSELKEFLGMTKVDTKLSMDN